MLQSKQIGPGFLMMCMDVPMVGLVISQFRVCCGHSYESHCHSTSSSCSQDSSMSRFFLSRKFFFCNQILYMSSLRVPFNVPNIQAVFALAETRVFKVS